jgi:hypothetical protein
MATNRFKAKGRRSSPPFFQLRHDLLDSERYINLPHTAKSLLMDLVRQYNGNNNGDICVTLTVLEKRGWNSNSTLRRALKALLDAELLLLTRQGGLNRCSLYAFSWLPIDECKQKLNVRSTTTAPIPLSKLLPKQNRQALLRTT